MSRSDIGNRIMQDYEKVLSSSDNPRDNEVLTIHVTRRTLVFAINCVDAMAKDVTESRYRDWFQETHNELRREEERMLRGYGEGVMHA